MINTSIPLSDASSEYLEKLLNNVPVNMRNVVWHQLNNDIKKVKGIWKLIDSKNKLAHNKNKSIVNK